MTSIANRGRPRGEHRARLTSWASEQTGPFTMAQLARSLNWSLSAANKALHRAREAGELAVVGTTRTDAKRPVVLYDVPGRTADARGLDAVMTRWAAS